MTGANSGEEFFEGRQHLSHYMAMDVSQPVGNWHISELLWSGLTEAYAEGGCEVHVHFRASIVNSGIAGDWCTIFNRAEDWFDFIDCEAHRHNKAESRSCEKRSMGQPVLVDVGKLVELPEGIVGESLPSVVRLQLLDSCLRSWVDASDFVTAFARLHFPVTKDGELQQTRSVVRQGIDANVGDGKLVDQIVEGRTEVVEAVPDNQAQFVSGRRVEHFDPEELLAAINIGFGPSSVRAFFNPSSNFRLKTLQVVNSSAESPFVVEGHGVEEWRGADMADKHDKCSLAREVEPSQKTEKGLDTSALKPLVKLAFHER